MASINEILLRVEAESEDAEDSLEDVARKLNELDAEKAEAEVRAETRQARTELKAMERELRSLDRMSVSPEVEVDLLDAEFELAALQRQLAAIDREDIEIDVEVHETINRDVDSLRARMAGLRDAFGDAADGADLLDDSIGGGGLGGGVQSLGGQLVPLGGSLQVIAIIAAALIPVIAAIAGAIGALVASLAYALAGAGALATAFGSVLLPFIALGIGAVQRFSDTVAKAGSAAHKLAAAASDVSSAFAKAVAPGADAVFAGMADGLRSILPLVRSLQGPLTTLGKAVGDAFRTLGAELARPAWQSFFSMLANAAAQITPALTSSFVSLARILRDIAAAAMPFLISGLRQIADGLRSISNSTGGVEGLRGSIGGLVSQLGSWLDLIGQIGRVFLNFFAAAAPQGQQLVQWLTEGARALADWLGSAEGIAKVRDFLADVLPLAKELIEFFGRLAVAILAIGQALAPVLTPAIAGLNTLLGIITKAAGVFGDLLGPVGDLMDALGPLGVVLLPVMGPLGLLIGLLSKLGPIVDVAVGVIGDFLGLIGDLAGKLGGLGGIAAGLGVILAAPFLLAVAPLVGLIALLSKVPGLLSGLGGAAEDAFGGIKGLASDAADTVKGAFGVGGDGGGPNLLTSLRDQAVDLAGSVDVLAARFRSAGVRGAQGLAAGIRSGTANAAAAGRALLQSVGTQGGAAQTIAVLRQAGVNGARSLVQGLVSGRISVAQAGRQLIQALSQGARGGAGQLRQAGSNAGRQFGAGARQGQGPARQAGSQLSAALTAAVRAGGRLLSGVGKAAGNLFSRGVTSARGDAQRGGQNLAESGAAGARQGGRRFDPAGREGGGRFAQGLRSTVGQVVAAAQAITAICIATFTSVAAQAVGAGAAVGANFAAGIRSQVGAVAAAAQELANAARDQLPGSEPKDHSSPLYGLGDAGRALVSNFAAGISAATPAAVAAVVKMGTALRERIGAISAPMAAALEGILDPEALAGRIVRVLKKVRELGRELKANARAQKALQKDLDSDDLGSKRIARLQRQLSGADSDKERKALQAKIDELTNERKQKLEGQLGKLRGKGSEIKDAIGDQKQKLRDARRQLAEAMKQVLGNALGSAAEGLMNLKSLQADLGETIKRIFAEGASGAFGVNAARSGELEGSIISGLDTQSWLEQLVAEIQGQAGLTIEQILAKLQLAGEAGGLAPGEGGSYISGDVYNGPVDQSITNIINAPKSGGEVDPRAALAKISREQRKKGRSSRR